MSAEDRMEILSKKIYDQIDIVLPNLAREFAFQSSVCGLLADLASRRNGRVRKWMRRFHYWHAPKHGSWLGERY